MRNVLGVGWSGTWEQARYIRLVSSDPWCGHSPAIYMGLGRLLHYWIPAFEGEQFAELWTAASRWSGVVEDGPADPKHS